MSISTRSVRKKMWGRKKRGKEDFPRKKNQEGRGKNKGRVYLKIGGIRSLNLGIGISEGKNIFRPVSIII